MPFSKADDRHLDQTALISPMKSRMRLDAVDEDHSLRLVRVAIHEHRHRRVPLFELYHVHRGADGSADRFFENAVRAKDCRLTFGGGAPMAAHRWHDKGSSAAAFHVFADFPDDGLEVVDAP